MALLSRLPFNTPAEAREEIQQCSTAGELQAQLRIIQWERQRLDLLVQSITSSGMGRIEKWFKRRTIKSRLDTLVAANIAIDERILGIQTDL